MSQESIENLRTFFIQHGWSKGKKLTLETAIENDLGITGDDADEFLISFGKYFSVDVSQFPIGDYFEDEGDQILPTLIRFILRKKKRPKKILTINHLLKAISKGSLNEEALTI